MIRLANPEDAAAICAVYNPYVLSAGTTFEEQMVTEQTMVDRIIDITRSLPWLVFEAEGKVVGYAYANQWKVRAAYRFSAETTIYVANACCQKGVGSLLYRELIERLRQQGLHSVIGGVLLPNAASIALHERLGFKKVAHFEQVGRKFDRWIDVGYWQLNF